MATRGSWGSLSCRGSLQPYAPTPVYGLAWPRGTSSWVSAPSFACASPASVAGHRRRCIGLQRHGKLTTHATQGETVQQEEVALAEAQRKLELLRQQAALVEQLKRHMSEQDELIGLLEKETRDNKRVQQERAAASSARVSELEEQIRLFSELQQLEQQQQQLQLQRQQQEGAAAAAAAAEQRQQQQQQQSQAAAERAAELEKQLEAKRAELEGVQARVKELSASCDVLRESAERSREAAAEAAGQLAMMSVSDATSSVDDMGGPLGPGPAGGRGGPRGKGPRGKGVKGGAAAAAGASVGAGASAGGAAISGESVQLLQWQAMVLRQSLEKQQAEIEDLRKTHAERESRTAAIQRSLQALGSNYELQAARLLEGTAESARIQQQLQQLQQQREDYAAEVQELLLAPVPAELAAEVAELEGQLEAVAAEGKTLGEEMKARVREVEEGEARVAMAEREKKEEDAARRLAEEEAESLREELEEREREHAPLQAIRDQLAEMGQGLEEAVGLRHDLQVLAEAFHEKEEEVAALILAPQEAGPKLEAAKRSLSEARQRQALTTQQLEAGKKQAGQLQASVEQAQEINDKLTVVNEELKAQMRAQDVVTAAVESKTSAMEASLVSYSNEIMGLKGQLAQAEHSLVEAGQLLRESEVSEASARSLITTLTAELEQLRGGVSDRELEVQQLTRELEASNKEVQTLCFMDDALRNARSQLAAVEEDLASARAELRGAEASKQQAAAMLAASMQEAVQLEAALRESEVTREADVVESLRIQEALREEIEERKLDLRAEAENRLGAGLSAEWDVEEAERVATELEKSTRNVRDLQALLAQDEALLQAEAAQHAAFEAEARRVERHITNLASELELSRLEAARQAGLAEQYSATANAAQEVLSALQSDLREELERTTRLLGQAEQLLIMRTMESDSEDEEEGTAARRRSMRKPEEVEEEVAGLQEEVSRLQTQVRHMELEGQDSAEATRQVQEAEERAAAIRSDSVALRRRVSELEAAASAAAASGTGRDPAGVGSGSKARTGSSGSSDNGSSSSSDNGSSSSNNSSNGDAPPKLKELTVQVETLQDENVRLRQLSAQQQQLLNQAMRFLQARMRKVNARSGSGV